MAIKQTPLTSQTVLSYDRIIVLEAGTVAENGSPLELFDQGGIFTVRRRLESPALSLVQSMCEASGIARAEIIANET